MELMCSYMSGDRRLKSLPRLKVASNPTIMEVNARSVSKKIAAFASNTSDRSTVKSLFVDDPGSLTCLNANIGEQTPVKRKLNADALVDFSRPLRAEYKSKSTPFA